MVPSIEELVEIQLEAIDELKTRIKEETSESTKMILRRKLKYMEDSLRNHKHSIRQIKIDKLIN